MKQPLKAVLWMMTLTICVATVQAGYTETMDPNSFAKNLKSDYGLVAVYATRPYVVLGEVSPNWGKRNEHGYKTYVATNEDIRFTRNKANTVLYATALMWPGDRMVIKTLAGVDLAGVKSARLLGVDRDLKWRKTEQGTGISLPEKPDYGVAYPVRIAFSDRIVKPLRK